MSAERVEARPGAFADSVALMRFSADVRQADGVRAGLIAMATELNLDLRPAMGFEPPAARPRPPRPTSMPDNVPEPTGVVVIVAPADSSLLGLISVVAPVIVTGNTAVVIASESRPLPAISLAEVLATPDLPAGVVNVLTGRTAELAPVLAGHMDVNAIDLTGVNSAARSELEQLAAGNVKRVRHGNEDWAANPGTHRLMSFLEIKTVWHLAGT